MKLTGLHLLLTYRCTYECDHCFVCSSPNAEATITFAMASDAIKQAAELGTIEDIYFEGGEPMLCYPILLDLVRFAHVRGLRTGIVTNGFYAESVDDAERWFMPLKNAGLTSLSISDDSFHSDDSVPVSNAKRAIEAAKRLGIAVDSICIERPTARETHSKGEPITGGKVRFRGRAVEKLADETLPKHKWNTFTECPDEDFVEIGRLHLDPHGHLFACQGIVVGNLNHKSLAEIVRDYNPETHPIIGPLLRGGPAELVRAFDLSLRESYLDACHLCYLARKMLRERFPDLLAPAVVYGEEG